MSTVNVTANRPARRLGSAGRLRVWAAALVLGAAVLLAVTGIGISRQRGQVHIIGDQAAVQAATAADLYVALSDLDAQVARLLMLSHADTMSSNRLDALRGYQQRSAEINADLAAAVRGASSALDRARIGRLADQLAVYRQWAWQAIAAQSLAVEQIPGRPPTAALGYYTLASTMLHGDLLPAVTALRQSSQDSLTRAYTAQRSTATWASVLTVLCGGVLFAALILFQVRLARRFHRLLNPSLLVATLAVGALVIASCVVFSSETALLRRAERQDFAPYLGLIQAQAISYDAAGDTSRYLMVADPAFVQADLRAKAHCLVSGGSCQPGDEPLTGGCWLPGRCFPGC